MKYFSLLLVLLHFQSVELPPDSSQESNESITCDDFEYSEEIIDDDFEPIKLQDNSAIIKVEEKLIELQKDNQ